MQQMLCLLSMLLQAVALRERLHDVMEMVVAKVVRRQISAAWRSWTVYMLRRRQQHQALHEVYTAVAIDIWCGWPAH